MKIFDLHADLSEALKVHPDEDQVLNTYWVERFNAGEIRYTSAASFFAGDESWEFMQNLVTRVKNDIESSHAKRILTKEDLDENATEITYLQTIEGMCGIREDVSAKVEWLYNQGNRIGSLEWNDENALATGNFGNPARGLTELGREAISKMNELHFIVDVSHANEKTFWDIMDASSLPVVATHSNAKALCYVERNLTDQQIRVLAQKGGLIGLNACAGFIHPEKEKQDAWHLAKHARYIANLVGVEHVAVGFDLGSYYGNHDKHNIHEPEQAQNFISGLRKEGFPEDEIEDIAYRNVIRFLQKWL